LGEPPGSPKPLPLVRFADGRYASDQKFTEPVALSSTASVDLPLPGTALGCDFVLLALRARCKQHTNELAETVKGSEEAVSANCDLFFFQQCTSDSCRLTRLQKDESPARGRDQKNSPSRFRFRPPLPLTFPFRVLPSDSVSTYLRSVLGASSNLTSATRGSRGREKTWPQFAEISFLNISTAFLPTCGQGCGEDLRARTRAVHRCLQARSTTRTASAGSSRSSASGTAPTPMPPDPRTPRRPGRDRERRRRRARRDPAT
jgi:hypothetical protein